MKLNDAQKAAVLAAKGDGRYGMVDPKLVRVGDAWICVWQEPEQAPDNRWHAQRVHSVPINLDATKLIGFNVYEAWFDGVAHGVARTRRDALQQLKDLL